MTIADMKRRSVGVKWVSSSHEILDETNLIPAFSPSARSVLSQGGPMEISWWTFVKQKSQIPYVQIGRGFWFSR